MTVTTPFVGDLILVRTGAQSRDADTDLIAAAPDLLTACESARTGISDYLCGDWDGNIRGWEAIIDRLVDAIAKAEKVRTLQTAELG